MAIQVEQCSIQYCSHVRLQEVSGLLVPSLILLLHFRIFEIRPCTHPTMRHIVVDFKVILDLQALLVFLELRKRLVLTQLNKRRNFDFLCFTRIHQGRTRLHPDLDLGISPADEGNHLAAPTIAHSTPGLDVGIQLLGFFNDAWDFGEMLGWRRNSKPLPEFLLVLWVVRRHEPLHFRPVAVEEVGHDDLTWLILVRVGENIGSLKDLPREAHDVVEHEDCCFSILWTSGAGNVRVQRPVEQSNSLCLVSAKSNVAALLRVVVDYNGGNACTFVSVKSGLRFWLNTYVQQALLCLDILFLDCMSMEERCLFSLKA